jgi:ABC-type dipeptide/oligopeptide/nickel transport system permease subunit
MSDLNKNNTPELRKEDFEFVQADSKIYDKKFETKPIGYFKDAMLRFSKNKTNVVATTILFTIILLSIVIPIISTKNTEDVDLNYGNLPPRMPILELIGVADGTSKIVDQPVNLETIGEIEEYPELGLPYDSVELGTTVLEEYIVEGTLTNYSLTCTDKKIACIGGEVSLRVRTLYDHVSIVAPIYEGLAVDNGAYVYVNVNEFHLDGTFEVYGRYTWTEETTADDPETEEDEQVIDRFYGDYVLLGTTTEGTELDLDPTQVLPGDYAENTFNFELKLTYITDDIYAQVIFDEVEIGDASTEESFIEYTGYSLSQFKYDSEDILSNGLFSRQNGEILYASYTYRDYDATFSDTIENAYAQSKYNDAMEEFADVCVLQNPGVATENNFWVGAVYNEECPIKEVIGTTSIVYDPYGNANFSYIVLLNHSQLEGYTDMPYFLFGTDSAGRDLFTLLWVATRTSLLLGFIVAGINVTVGVVYGSIAGYYGGWTDLLMQRVMEVVGRIPLLVTLSIMIAIFGPGIQTLILILIVSGWIGIASITRTQFYRYKGREYVLASRTLGAKDGRLIFRHILPNGIGTIITQSVLTIPGVIFTESTLSYLGFGIGHGQSFNIFGIEFSGVSVGVLLSDGQTELTNRPYLTVFPAILISILMITFNMFGNALRDAFNPALRGSE